MNKRRILISVISIIVTLSAVLITNRRAEESIETVSLPVTGKVIVLDARAPENLMRELKVLQEQQKQKRT